MVCNKVCLGAMSTYSLLTGDKSQFSLVDESPRRGFMTTEFFWRICL